ncbi:MAG: hypothetical protein JOY69_11080 [Candidatus Eremiobacteraeota bacterium]|nr:hypothetical protein [Candidatus Eremiobacteraeota bacterium]
MMRSRSFPSLAFAAFIAAVGSAALAAPAETVAYSYPALPGPVANCVWFDDNLNDHSIDAIIRQTDLLYNRAPLPPGATVAVSQTGTTARGDQIAQFTLNGRLLCAGATAFHPEMTEATPTPPDI